MSLIAGKKIYKKPVKIKRIIFILSFIIMPTLNFLIFYCFINFNSFVMAFQRTVGGKTIFVTTNFSDFFLEFSKTTSDIKIGLRNTLITFAVSLGMFPVSFFVSFFLYKKIPAHNIFRFIFFIPGLITGTVVASFYMKFVGVFGPVAKIVQKLFNLSYVPTLLAEDKFANTFVLLQLIWLSFPGDMIIWGGTFSRIPTSVLESARLDGVGFTREAIQIIVPIVWPTVALKLVLSFVGIFGAGGNVFLLTEGRNNTQTLSNWMYMQVYNQGGYIRNSNVLNYLAAVGIMLTAVTLSISFIVRFITGKMDKEVTF